MLAVYELIMLKLNMSILQIQMRNLNYNDIKTDSADHEQTDFKQPFQCIHICSI